MINVLITYTEGGAKGSYIEQSMELPYCDKLTPTWARIATRQLFGYPADIPPGIVVWENPPLRPPGEYIGYKLYPNTDRKVKRIIKEPIT